MAERCRWCGRSDEGVRTVTVRAPGRLATAVHERRVPVHPDHEPPLRRHLERERTWGRPYLGSVGVLLAALLVGPVLAPGAGGPVAGGALVALGLLTALLPFSPRETTTMLGVRRARRLVRVLAAALVALGVWVAVGAPA